METLAEIKHEIDLHKKFVNRALRVVRAMSDHPNIEMTSLIFEQHTLRLINDAIGSNFYVILHWESENIPGKIAICVDHIGDIISCLKLMRKTMCEDRHTWFGQNAIMTLDYNEEILYTVY